MQKYRVEIKPVRTCNFNQYNTAVIYLLDEKAIFDSITCEEYHDAFNSPKYYSISVEFKNETPEVREKFSDLYHRIYSYSTLPKDIEFKSLKGEIHMKQIDQFVNLIQEVDSVPTSAFVEVMNGINFPLYEIRQANYLEMSVKSGQIMPAIERALFLHHKGYFKMFNLLANLCVEANKLEEYLQILNSYPKDHPQYQLANQMLLEHVLSLPVPDNTQSKINLLERKFKYALQANLIMEATNFFNELIGNCGLNPEITEIQGDADTLIKVAHKIRQLNQQIAQLKLESRDRTQSRAPATLFRMG